MTSATVALALGGNQGPVERTLRFALRQLRASLGPLAVASLYRSRAVSPIPQPDYLNTAALAHTALPPEGVLALAKALERAAGRRRDGGDGRGARFGPRPLDIDLLLYDGLCSDAAEMTLPHPRLRQRRFVLEPLAEIAPDLPVPPDGVPVRELLARVVSQMGPEPGGFLERVARAGWDLR